MDCRHGIRTALRACGWLFAEVAEGVMVKASFGPIGDDPGFGLCWNGLVEFCLPLAKTGVQQDPPLHVRLSVASQTDSPKLHDCMTETGSYTSSFEVLRASDNLPDSAKLDANFA